MSRKIPTISLIIFLISLFLSGSFNLAWSKAGLPKPEGTFVIGTTYNFANIDPNKTGGGVDIVHTFQTLVQASVIDYHIMSNLAESWELLNPLAWKFNIRRGVKFHNGQLLTSADIQYSFYRQMGKINRRFPGANRGTWRRLVDRIETPDDHTIILHTKKPDPSVLYIVRWMFIVPKSHIESVGDDKFSKMPVGTGAFMYKERKIGESLTLEANPDFWNVNPEKGARGPARVKRVKYRTMPKEQTRIAAMKAGEIDGTSIGRDTVEIFENDKNFNIYYSGKNQSVFVMFNWRDEKDAKTGKPNPFTDVRVRRAMNHAVNVDALIQNYGTGREYRTTILGKDGIGYNPNVPFYEYDPEKAKKLMAEAGYDKGLKTTFYTTADPQAYLQALLQYLRDIGIQIKIQQTTPAVAMTNMIRKRLYGMLIWGGGLGGPDPAGTFFKTCISYNGNWAMHGKDERVEKLVKKQMVEFDVEKRAQLIDEVIQILWKDAWFIPLWEPVYIKVVNAKWNYDNAPTAGGFNLPDLWLKK